MTRPKYKHECGKPHHEYKITLPGGVEHFFSSGAGRKHKTWWRTLAHTVAKRPDVADVGVMPHVLRAVCENA